MQRIDLYLTQMGFFASRQQCVDAISASLVSVNGKPVTKVSIKVSDTDEIKVLDKAHPFVSRGGLKLQKALTEFGLDVKGKTCLDIGASTGGFTHCLLREGAARVFCVDVGRNQLAESLISDSRVINLEKTDIRNVTAKTLENAEIQFACVDVSFISVLNIIDAIKRLLMPGGMAVILIKPQFECETRKFKNNIVKDAKVHYNVIRNLLVKINNMGLSCVGLDFSPIKGREGNIEYLMSLKNTQNQSESPDIKNVIDNANKALKE